MAGPSLKWASFNDPSSPERVADWLNSLPPMDWRIAEYSPERSRLMICAEMGERQICIMCLSTWYVRSQIHIPSPTFAMEAGRKKMAFGMLSSACYDHAIKLAMDDGAHVSEVICDFIAAGELPSEGVT